jgi:mycofactocin system creatininase family protein
VTVFLERAAWPAVPGSPLALVPLGSTEQHGPHLPFSTDCTIAAAVAAGAANALSAGGGARAVVLPVIPYGASGEHQSFPGTVSIGHDALQGMITELVRSLATWAGRIVFVNGHGGNVTSLALVIPRMIAEDHDVAWAPCSVVGGDAHAGRTETSIMLHLAPDVVDLGLSSPGNTAPLSQLLPLMREGGTRAVSPSGVLGDPTDANAAEGAERLAEMVDGVVRRLHGASVDEYGCLREIRVTADSVPGAEP